MMPGPQGWNGYHWEWNEFFDGDDYYENRYVDANNSLMDLIGVCEGDNRNEHFKDSWANQEVAWRSAADDDTDEFNHKIQGRCQLDCPTPYYETCVENYQFN